MWEHVRGLGGDHLYVGACWGGGRAPPLPALTRVGLLGT